jgi:RpiB/LacA/LacB family sugar-phosphate isomerase
VRKAKLTAGKATAFAWLNSTRTADTIWESLPLRGTAHAWGNEIYFGIPVELGEENARQTVNFGDLAFWPDGNCLCVFFGQTPASRGDEIRAASPVNVLGRIINDPRVFEGMSEIEVLVERVQGGVESVAIGTDEHNPLVEAVTGYLDDAGIKYRLFDPGPWPDVAEKVAMTVASGECDEGILFCWTGTGVSLAANKVLGVRAVLCHNPEVAVGARKWNHANVLVMGLGFTTPAVAQDILKAWFSTSYDDDEAVNVARVAEMERRHCT